MVFAAIASIIFTFVASSPVSAQEDKSGTWTIKQFAQLQVGEYRVASEVEGSPEKDGFPLAVETRQYKYNAGDTLAIHYTVARYSSPAEAQNMLRTILDRYRQMKLNITPVANMRDKDRKITGISRGHVGENVRSLLDKRRIRDPRNGRERRRRGIFQRPLNFINRGHLAQYRINYRCYLDRQRRIVSETEFKTPR